MYDLQTIRLSGGAHNPGDREMCAMEAVAFLAGERHTDHPDCVCPVIAEFVRVTNDWFTGQERNEHLLPLLFDFVGTRDLAGRGHRFARAAKAVDCAVRVFLPLYLSTTGRHSEAATLRRLPEITTRPTAMGAYGVLCDLYVSDVVMSARSATYYLGYYQEAGDDSDAVNRAAGCVAVIASTIGIDRARLVDESIKCIKAMLAIGDRTPRECVRSLEDLACAMTVSG